MPFEPVPAAKQKEALELLREHLFSPRAFQFSPQLLNKLASPRFSDFCNFLAMRTRFDLPIHDMVLSLQNQVLDRLFHPLVLGRILDSEVKVAAPADAFSLGLLFNGIQDSIWAETKAPGESLNIDSYRRALPRGAPRELTRLGFCGKGGAGDGEAPASHGLVWLRGRQ